LRQAVVVRLFRIAIFPQILAHYEYVERGHDIIDVSLQVGPIQYNGMKDGTPCCGLYNVNFFPVKSFS